MSNINDKTRQNLILIYLIKSVTDTIQINQLTNQFCQTIELIHF